MRRPGGGVALPTLAAQAPVRAKPRPSAERREGGTGDAREPGADDLGAGRRRLLTAGSPSLTPFRRRPWPTRPSTASPSIPSTAWFDFPDAVPMFAAMSAYAPTPLARVPWNDPAAIMKLLDAGAYGVICPMINTAGECERFVGACRYAPAGYRSFGPARGLLYGGPDYAAEGQRHHCRDGDDRDEPKRWTMWTRSCRSPASTASISAPTTSPSASATRPTPSRRRRTCSKPARRCLPRPGVTVWRRGCTPLRALRRRDKIDKGYTFVTIATTRACWRRRGGARSPPPRGGNA